MPSGKRIHSNRNETLPSPRNEDQEVRKNEKGVVFCSECGAVHYMKSWRHALEEYKSLSDNASVKFSLCPACEMIKNHQFEGKVTITHIPEKEVGEVARLIENFGARAKERDVLHRLIEIKKTESAKGVDLVVTTTENQLANKLADKIKETFHHVKLSRSFSPAPSDVEYVTIEFTGA